MKVGISTKNPLKIETVRECFEQVFGKIEVFPIDVKSGVPDQPKGDEIIRGAKNRALAALKENDFGVGIEAGIINMFGRWFDTAYCVIIDKNGKCSIGSQPIFELPEIFHEKLLSGIELGKVAGEYFNQENLKHNAGAVGALSKGFITRKDLIKSAVKTALIPWISRELYNK